MRKIYPINELINILKKQKKHNDKIVLCHGVFDLLHIGHIKHFQKAKKYGSLLIVSITPDKFVNKGPGRPAFNEKLRLESIAALDSVDYVVLNTTPTAIHPIIKLKPNIYCKGKDYKIYKDDISGEIRNEIKAVKKIKGKIVFTETEKFSSSTLINEYSGIYSDKQKILLNLVKQKFDFKKIRKIIDGFKNLKVLVIGETIIDQYVFCEALGKSGKEPMLVLRNLKTEEYLGGAAAVARHISEFCEKISLLSMIGQDGKYLNFIKKNLPKNVDFSFIKKKNSPTIVKKRFVDNSANTNNKVLGVYDINDDILSEEGEKKFSKLLKKKLPKYDLVIVSDYGHGFISSNSAKLICKYSKYLALNAQINAANVGYHSMRNYKNVNCVIINEKEIRHEMRSKNKSMEFLMKKLSREQNIESLVVTRGKDGSILYNRKKNKIDRCEAYAKSSVDKIGAGDTMLSILSLFLKCKLDKNLALLTASLAAAQSIESIGNKNHIKKIKILKAIENILK